MAKTTQKKIDKQVRKTLRDDCGEDVRILHVQTAMRAKTGKPIYLYHAALESAPNVLVRSIGVDEDGSVIDLEALQEEEGRSVKEIFARKDIDVVRVPLRPAQAAAAASIDPEQNLIELNEGEPLQEVITVTVPGRPPAGLLDVYFLADVTGSMTAVLQAVQDSANAILSSVRGSGVDVAFGVGSYRDFPGPTSSVFMAQQAITTNDTDVVAAIGDWNAFGGGDIPEGQLYALDRVAADDGGKIGWRPNSQRIVVWFGDAPGHEPVCPALSGLANSISTASVVLALTAANIAVVAISAATGAATNLDSDPTFDARNYVDDCGAPGGFPAQATTIASATGGMHLIGIDEDAIVGAIVSAIEETEATIAEVRLDPFGPSTGFVESISPPEYGPLPAGEDQTLEFTVNFLGNVACSDEPQVFEGQIALVVDNVAVASKRLQVTVPACQDVPPPPPPPPPPTSYEVESSPSAVALIPGRTPSRLWEISVFARIDGGGLIRAFNSGDPEIAGNWNREERPPPGGPGGTRVSFAPFALWTRQPTVDQSFDFVHAFARGTDSDLHDITRSATSWFSWTDRGDPRTAVADAPAAVRARRTFYYDDDDGDDFLTDADDQVFMFVWGGDGSLYRFFQWWRPHGRPPGADLGGPPNGIYPIAPGISRVYVFVVGNDRQLWVNHSNDPQHETWIWRSLGRPSAGVGAYWFRRPAVVRFREPGAAGQPRYAANVFVPTEDGGLWLNRWEGAIGQTNPPFSWTNLGRPSGAVTVRRSASAVTHDDGTTNRIYAFVVGSDKKLWVNVRDAGAAIGQWRTLGSPSGIELRGQPSAVEATHPGSDPIYAFVRGSDDFLHYCHINPAATASQWKTIP